MRPRDVERELGNHETVEEAVLTLAAVDESPLVFPPIEGGSDSDAVGRRVHAGRWLEACARG